MAASDRPHSRSRSSARNSPHTSSRTASATGRSASSIRKGSAVVISDSPPLTSSLHSRNSASSHQETIYLKQIFLLKCARFGLTAFIIAFGVGVLICEGDVLKRYNDTNLDGAWNLPLWPLTVDVRPTLVTMIVAALAIGLSLTYVVVALIPSPHSRTTIINATFGTISALSFALTVIAVAYSPIFIHRIFSPFANANTSINDSRDTIQTWTCGLYNNVNVFNAEAAVLQLPTLSASTDLINPPEGFRRMCTESRVGYGLMVGLCVLEVIALSVALIGVGLEKRIAKLRKARYADRGFEKA